MEKKGSGRWISLLIIIILLVIIGLQNLCMLPTYRNCCKGGENHHPKTFAKVLIDTLHYDTSMIVGWPATKNDICGFKNAPVTMFGGVITINGLSQMLAVAQSTPGATGIRYYFGLGAGQTSFYYCADPNSLSGGSPANPFFQLPNMDIGFCPANCGFFNPSVMCQ